jgi:hypothetical protein
METADRTIAKSAMTASRWPHLPHAHYRPGALDAERMGARARIFTGENRLKLDPMFAFCSNT